MGCLSTLEEFQRKEIDVVKPVLTRRVKTRKICLRTVKATLDNVTFPSQDQAVVFLSSGFLYFEYFLWSGFLHFEYANAFNFW